MKQTSNCVASQSQAFVVIIYSFDLSSIVAGSSRLPVSLYLLVFSCVSAVDVVVLLLSLFVVVIVPSTSSSFVIFLVSVPVLDVCPDSVLVVVSVLSSAYVTVFAIVRLSLALSLVSDNPCDVVALVPSLSVVTVLELLPFSVRILSAVVAVLSVAPVCPCVETVPVWVAVVVFVDDSFPPDWSDGYTQSKEVGRPLPSVSKAVPVL